MSRLACIALLLLTGCGHYGAPVRATTGSPEPVKVQVRPECQSEECEAQRRGEEGRAEEEVP